MKLVLNNVSHYILDVHTGGTYLLGDETRGSHAGRGVHFKQVYLVAFGNDVVYADNALCA